MIGIALALALAQDATWVETRFHRVHLRNGNFIDGHLLSENRGLVLLKIVPTGEFGVRRDMIDRVEFIKMRSIQEAPPVVRAPKTPAAIANVAAEDPAEDAAEEKSAAAAPVSPEVKRAVDTALVAYASSSAEARRPLANRINELGAEAVAYACWLALHGKPAVERSLLVEAIAACESPEVLPTLLQLAASSSDSFSRGAAVKALTRSSKPEAVAAVRRALGDPAGQVWRVALEALLEEHKKKPLDVEPLIDAMASARNKEAYMSALGKIGGEAALDALQERLRNGGSQERAAAMRALSSHKREEDGLLAADFLDQEDAELRREACQFMGRAKIEGSVQALLGLLEDENESVADAAHWALRQITGNSYAREPKTWQVWWEKVGKEKYPPFEE